MTTHDTELSPNPAESPSPPPSVSRLLLTIREAADVLGVGRTTIYDLIANDELEVVHIGRSARVPVAAIDEFVGRLRSGQAS